MVKRVDYAEEATMAARSVLIELVHLLAKYRDQFVVIGGWVPGLLIETAAENHTGSTDVDLAFNHLSLDEISYATIGKLLFERGYTEGSQPFIFHRIVVNNGHEYRVEVDFLAGEYKGTSSCHRHQRIQDIKARKARGCDLAFESYQEIKIIGRLPDGGKDEVIVRVAGIVPFLIMKSMALDDRMKEKDAWDIYYCLKNYPGGIEAIVDEFRGFINHRLVIEGLGKLAQKFKSPEHVGPQFIADFEGIEDSDDRAIIQLDAYERVQFLFRSIGFS